MKISELYGPHGPFVGQDAYLIGSGASMDVFPLKYLGDRCCVMLNDTQKNFPGLGPIAFSNNKKFLADCPLSYQIVKARLRFDPHPERDDNHVPWDHPRYYCFSYRDKKSDGAKDHFDPRRLWKEPCHYWNVPGGNVAIFAVQFCVLAGFRSINLVGCDCCQLGHYDYHSRKSGGAVRHDYEAYARGMLHLIQDVRIRFGIPIVTVSPFAGLGREQEQWQEMKAW